MQNHFELFGLPVRYTLDRQFLHRKYLALMRGAHPDLAGEDVDAQLEALQLSARVNEAYATLDDDLKRAEYLLALKGVSVADAKPPANAMERIFDLREALSTAAANGDEQRAQAARDEAVDWLARETGGLGGLLDSGEDVSHVAATLALAKYLKRLLGA